MAILRLPVTLFTILIFSFFLYADKVNEKKTIKIIIGHYEGKNGSIAPLSICPLGNGQFIGRQGERVTDEDIKKYLSSFLMDGCANLLLRFENEKNTSILDLSKIISRLKKLANEKIDTTIYIQISGI